MWWDFPRYVPVGEKKEKATRKLKALQKKNPNIKPVMIQGSAIAKTWWGKSWNQNLERYADYGNRIGRGRSYVRNGAVLDLQIGAGEVNSLVQGTASKPYSVTVKIKSIEKGTWKTIKAACQGKFDSLPELLEGKFPKSLGEILFAKGQGLFPSPKEIEFSCSCPDWAHMCKHVAATLYGIGARLDEDPLLFFKLRKADVHDLISEAVEDKARDLLQKAGRKSSRVIEETDLTKIFDIEMEDYSETVPARPSRRREEPVRKKAAKTSIVTKKTVRERKPVKEEPALKPSAAERVESIIQKSRKGVTMETLMKKTGFDERKIYGIVYRLRKKERIIMPKIGIYKSSEKS
jgi:uncharacterized Zn finger protein